MGLEKSAVRTVIEVLHDGEKGFRSFSEEIKDPTVKTYFAEESTTRGKFADELETALESVTGDDEEQGGMATGAVHRAWGELKSKLGGGDHTILATAEQGEDAAKKAYEEVLKVNEVSPPIKDLLRKQQAHILQSHDKVKAFRDSKAS